MSALPSSHVISHSGSHFLTPLSLFLWPPVLHRLPPVSSSLSSNGDKKTSSTKASSHVSPLHLFFLFLCLCPFIHTVSWTKRKWPGRDRGSVRRSLRLSGCQPLGSGWRPGVGSAPGSARLIEVPGGRRGAGGEGEGGGGVIYQTDIKKTESLGHEWHLWLKKNIRKKKKGNRSWGGRKKKCWKLLFVEFVVYSVCC